MPRLGFCLHTGSQEPYGLLQSLSSFNIRDAIDIALMSGLLYLAIGLIVLVVIFQPELRLLFERVAAWSLARDAEFSELRDAEELHCVLEGFSPEG